MQSLSGVLLLRTASGKGQADNLWPVPYAPRFQSCPDGLLPSPETAGKHREGQRQGLFHLKPVLKVTLPSLERDSVPAPEEKRGGKIQSLPFLTIQKETELRRKPSARAD